MGSRSTAGVVLLSLISLGAAAENKNLGQPFLGVDVSPGVVFPLPADAGLFSPGFGSYLTVYYKIKGRAPLHLLAETGYFLLPVRDSAFRPLNTPFRLTAGLHAELLACGLSCAADPASPYATLFKSGSAVDFLKLPRQTLKQKAGDCDDLTVLFCSPLESVGIESAFITVPGHIFPAVCLGVPHAEAARFVEGRTWLPLEITEMDGGFLQAWEAGARW